MTQVLSKTLPKTTLARRLDGVSESATLKLNSMVQSMRAQGIDVVNLSAGEPDFAVPDAAKDAIIEALKANRSKYTPVAGIPELRAAIVEKTNCQQPALAATIPWTAGDVVVSNGGKQALFNCLMALVDPDDEVLIPAPYWLSYPEMAKLAGGTPKIIPTRFEDGFKLTPASLRQTIASCRRPRILFLNSPSNPTGAMYSKKEFAALGEVLLSESAACDLWVLSDEIYDRIVLGEIAFCSFLEACPGLRERCVTVNGMSKSAAMTGWRIGWTVAPPALTAGLLTLQGQSTSGINSLAQWASVAALKLPESSFTEQVFRYRKRRDLALNILQKAGKLRIFPPEGAFYLFVGIQSALRGGEDANGFAERLLQEAKVAVVPGGPFGEPSSVRLSFATDESSLQEGCERIVKYLA